MTQLVTNRPMTVNTEYTGEVNAAGQPAGNGHYRHVKEPGENQRFVGTFSGSLGASLQQ